MLNSVSASIEARFLEILHDDMADNNSHKALRYNRDIFENEFFFQIDEA